MSKEAFRHGVSMFGYPVGLFTIIIYKKECVSDRMGQNVRVEDF